MGDGIVREVMSLVVEELCNEDMNLFVQGTDDERRLHPSAKSTVQLDHLAYFDFFGKLIGVALSGRSYLPANFSIPLHKAFIQVPLVVDDLRGIDSQLYRNVVEYNRGLTESELREQGINFTYQELSLIHI